MNSNEQIGELTQELFNAIEFGNERARTVCDKVEDFMCQQAEQIGKLSASLEIALNYQKSDNEKLEQQAEQIGVLKAHIKREESLGEDFARKYKQLKAENQRLKELLFRITQRYVFDMLKQDGDELVPLIKQALAAPPQKESE